MRDDGPGALGARWPLGRRPIAPALLRRYAWPPGTLAGKASGWVTRPRRSSSAWTTAATMNKRQRCWTPSGQFPGGATCWSGPAGVREGAGPGHRVRWPAPSIRWLEVHRPGTGPRWPRWAWTPPARPARGRASLSSRGATNFAHSRAGAASNIRVRPGGSGSACPSCTPTTPNAATPGTPTTARFRRRRAAGHLVGGGHRRHRPWVGGLVEAGQGGERGSRHGG